MNERILVLSKKDRLSLGQLRSIPNLRAATDGELIWLRGIPAYGTIDLIIKQIPAQRSYTLDEDNYLFPLNALTPTGKLKKLDWQNITSFLPIELPVAALPAQTDLQYPISLVKAKQTVEGTALLSDLEILKKYAEQAPAIRLQQMRFAVSEYDKVLMIGTPLLPIPGKEYWRRGNILLPSGYDFEFPLFADLIQSKLAPEKELFLLFDEKGDWEKIPFIDFKQGTRSAIRLTNGKERNNI